ncbi:MAG TPA: hypothetical protein VK879_19110 [Candidatus Sulfomarinibacteraceae bacterium]|nr:hypothetical protein [Candidatus Sulfomarinibacteraceae bacterium]
MRIRTQFGRLLFVLVVALLAACAPAAEEPSAQESQATEAQPTGAPNEIEKEAPELDEEEQQRAATKSPALATTPSPEEMAPMLGEESAPDATAITAEPVAPVTVDLSEMTPPAGGSAAGGEGEDPVEQPQPGSPNLSQTMSHRATMALADRLDVDVSKITIVSVEAVQWRDSSLGCPKPGMSYLMVITPGFRVILEVDGQTYEYHTDQRQNVVLCQGGSKPGLEQPPTPGVSDR